MKYVPILFLLAISIYPISYAKYNWDRKNKFGAIGSFLIALASVILPSVLILTR